jgi:hypothetical protein
VDNFGFVYYDAFGNIAAWNEAATHIPISGNPAVTP